MRVLIAAASSRPATRMRSSGSVWGCLRPRAGAGTGTRLRNDRWMRLAGPRSGAWRGACASWPKALPAEACSLSTAAISVRAAGRASEGADARAANADGARRPATHTRTSARARRATAWVALSAQRAGTAHPHGYALTFAPGAATLLRIGALAAVLGFDSIRGV